MGTLRSLGALARTLGPMVAASGECGFRKAPGLEDGVFLCPGSHAPSHCALHSHYKKPLLPAVYWLAGDRACFTVWSGLFLLPFLILRNLRPSTPAKAQ